LVSLYSSFREDWKLLRSSTFSNFFIASSRVFTPSSIFLKSFFFASFWTAEFALFSSLNSFLIASRTDSIVSVGGFLSSPTGGFLSSPTGGFLSSPTGGFLSSLVPDNSFSFFSKLSR